ncbi:MAG TPA: MobF family relaxase [Acidimicrobiales bacterium]|nr:MobF family relaxase [Acidimicrobiales bacterium]
MLRVSGLRDRTGAYYLADLAAEPGVVPGGPAACWVGDGAAGTAGPADLAGPVDAERLGLLLSGRHPRSGRPLVARPGPVAGYDLTFTVPKSVSLLAALSDPAVAAEVVAAHREAVQAAMDYVAGPAAAVRRGAADHRTVQPATGLAGAAFTHGTSRAADPHLHTHVVLPNVARGPDGRWTGLDSRGLFAHAAAAGQLHDAELRHRLARRLGLAWSRHPGGTLEVAGFDPEVVGAFSGRRAQIAQHLAAHGGVSSRADRVAWAATRDPKAAAAPDLLRRWWAARAAAAGFEPDRLQAAPYRASAAGPSYRASATEPPGRAGPSDRPVVDEHRFAAVLVRSVHATAARRDVVAAWASSLDGGAPAPDVLRCVDALSPWPAAVGAAEPRRAVAGLVPDGHLLAALGPRPGRPDQLAAWRSAAADIDRYRARWDVADVVHPLGDDRQRSRMPARQLADHLAVSRRVADARRLLGRDAGRHVDGPELRLGR